MFFLVSTNIDVRRECSRNFFQIKAMAKHIRDNQLMSASLSLPITIGTTPFWENASDTRTPAASAAPSVALTVDIPSPETDIPSPMTPSAPVFPDDDTVSVRTYTSTPPPFPDDGLCEVYIKFRICLACLVISQ